MNGIVLVKNNSGLNAKEKLQHLTCCRIERLELFAVHYAKDEKPVILGNPANLADIIRKKLPEQIDMKDKDVFYFLGEVPDKEKEGSELL